jgi:radical SAM superfamily enzyme YgiQ (UPF0313 family)
MSEKTEILLVKAGHLSGPSSVVPPSVRRLSGIFPSLGLGYIAAALRDEGIAVSLLDLDVEKEPEQALRHACARLKPPMVGFSATTLIWPTIAKMAGIVRDALPGSFLLCGGPHFTLYAEESLAASHFDAAVAGEGERTAAALAAAFLRHEPYDRIPGTVIKSGGGLQVNPPGPLEKNLDAFPFPARDLFPNDRYSCPLTAGPFTTLVTSRGCPFQCRYCTQVYWQDTFRVRSPENVFREMKACVETFGFREIMMYDETFTAPRKMVVALCDLIASEGLDIRWDIRTRIDALDETLLRHLRKAGCRRLHLGIETGSAEILRAMNKKITLDEIREMMALVKAMDFETLGYFMVGYPGETRRTAEETRRLSRDLGLDWAHYTVVTPAPGTPLYDYARKNGYLHRDYWRDYALGRCDHEIGHFVTEEFGEDDLAGLVKKAYRSFYFRPGQVLGKARRLASLKQFYHSLRGAAALMERQP